MRDGGAGSAVEGARHSAGGGANGASRLSSSFTSGRGGEMRTKMVCGEGSVLISERRRSGKKPHFAKRRRWLREGEGSRCRFESRVLLIVSVIHPFFWRLLINIKELT